MYLSLQQLIFALPCKKNQSIWYFPAKWARFHAMIRSISSSHRCQEVTFEMKGSDFEDPYLLHLCIVKIADPSNKILGHDIVNVTFLFGLSNISMFYHYKSIMWKLFTKTWSLDEFNNFLLQLLSSNANTYGVHLIMMIPYWKNCKKTTWFLQSCISFIYCWILTLISRMNSN